MFIIQLKLLWKDENRTIRYVYSNQAINELNTDEPNLTTSVDENQTQASSSVLDEINNEEHSQVALSKEFCFL